MGLVRSSHIVEPHSTGLALPPLEWLPSLAVPSNSKGDAAVKLMGLTKTPQRRVHCHISLNRSIAIPLCANMFAGIVSVTHISVTRLAS